MQGRMENCPGVSLRRLEGTEIQTQWREGLSLDPANRSKQPFSKEGGQTPMPTGDVPVTESS